MGTSILSGFQIFSLAVYVLLWWRLFTAGPLYRPETWSGVQPFPKAQIDRAWRQVKACVCGLFLLVFLLLRVSENGGWEKWFAAWWGGW